MSIFKRIASLFTGKSSDDRIMPIYARATRSRELVSGTVDLYNELSLAEGEDSDGYYVRKVLHTTGKNRVFEQVEIELWFDRHKRLDRYEVVGGKWLEPEAYAEELAREQASPEED